MASNAMSMGKSSISKQRETAMDKEELVNEFRELLDEVGFSYKVDDSTRPGAIVLSFGMKCGPGIGRVGAVFEFRETGIRIYGVALELAAAKDLPEWFKLLAMINFDLEAGCFEFEMASSQIRFRHFVVCEGLAEIPPDFVCDTLLLPFEMFSRYGGSFVALAEGFPDAAMAFGRRRKGDEG